MANAESIEEVFSDVLSEEQKQEAANQDVTHEDKPTLSGYMSKEDWEASGKDPKDWVSEDVFKERTLRIKNESRLKRELAETRKEFDSRLKDSNLLWQGQLARQRAELMEKRDNAVEVANLAEVKKLDKQINDLDKEADLVKENPQQVERPPEVVEWEEENDWVNDVNDPRTAVAQQAFGKAHQEGKTLAYCLRAADKAVAAMKSEEKQTTTSKKPPVSMADSSRSSTSAANDSANLTWSQLSSDDKAIYDELFSHKTQKEYLKIVADARRGAK